jgi:hypothetical protein
MKHINSPKQKLNIYICYYADNDMRMYMYIHSQFHTHQVDTINMYLYINVLCMFININCALCKRKLTNLSCNYLETLIASNFT